jgi:transcriptional regulator with XRE-family HTH domain
MTMPGAEASTTPFEMDGLSLIAWNLRLLRTERGYTQDRLALEAGVDRKFIGWLEGRKGNPTLRMLERLAVTLSVPLELFFAPPPSGSVPPQTLKSGRKRTDKPGVQQGFHFRRTIASS